MLAFSAIWSNRAGDLRTWKGLVSLRRIVSPSCSPCMWNFPRANTTFRTSVLVRCMRKVSKKAISRWFALFYLLLLLIAFNADSSTHDRCAILNESHRVQRGAGAITTRLPWRDTRWGNMLFCYLLRTGLGDDSRHHEAIGVLVSKYFLKLFCTFVCLGFVRFFLKRYVVSSGICASASVPLDKYAAVRKVSPGRELSGALPPLLRSSHQLERFCSSGLRICR